MRSLRSPRPVLDLHPEHSGKSWRARLSWLVAFGLVAAGAAACSADAAVLTLTVDVQGAACVDKLADGRCDAEFSRPGIDASLQSDYLQSLPYAAVMVIALDQAELIEYSSPGAHLKQARDLGGATQLSYAIDLDHPELARLGQQVHIDRQGERRVGKDGDRRAVWMRLDYPYNPKAFAPARIRSIELQFVLRYQVDLPDNAAANDAVPVVYGGRAVLDGEALARALEARGRDNVLVARFDPVVIERWQDAAGQPVEHVEQLDLVIAD